MTLRPDMSGGDGGDGQSNSDGKASSLSVTFFWPWQSCLTIHHDSIVYLCRVLLFARIGYTVRNDQDICMYVLGQVYRLFHLL